MQRRNERTPHEDEIADPAASWRRCFDSPGVSKSENPEDWVVDCRDTSVAEARQFRQVPTKSTPSNMALAGGIFSIPVLIIAMIALLLAGFSLGAALLISLALQTTTFCGLIVLGLARSSGTNTQKRASQNSDVQASDTAEKRWVHPGQDRAKPEGGSGAH